MIERIREYIKRKMTFRFICIQATDIAITVIIVLALSGIIRWSYCYAALGAYGAVSFVLWISKVWRKTGTKKKGGTRVWEK